MFPTKHFFPPMNSTPSICCWMLLWNSLDPTVSVFDIILTIVDTHGHFCGSSNLCVFLFSLFSLSAWWVNSRRKRRSKMSLFGVDCVRSKERGEWLCGNATVAVSEEWKYNDPVRCCMFYYEIHRSVCEITPNAHKHGVCFLFSSI